MRTVHVYVCVCDGGGDIGMLHMQNYISDSNDQNSRAIAIEMTFNTS